MTTFYFIAGASGSGKTAIISDLKKILGDSVSIYDFDDIGVPDGADKKWRQEATEKWLQKLLSESKDACLLGQIVLGEILACPSAKQIDKVNFCLLDVSDFERIQRLKKRNTHGADQNMLNWSSWLRMHHHDPQWMQHVLKEDCIKLNEIPRKFVVSDFKVKKLSEDVMLATYKTTEDGVTSLRSSIWKCHGDVWQMIFHQGTKCGEVV